ncbi:MAG: hypothetical protein QOJ38_1258 [Solirubrobacterales bacterium]|nr:hypothetical protein [Solirubrobacterales bacterium]
MARELPHVDGVEHRYLDVNGFSMHVAEAGSGDPLILLHGWPQHWYMWRQVIPTLAERFRLICPDLRGFGWSATPGHGYDPPTFAKDTIALLDALEIERAGIVGHDWGGYAALIAGTIAPERFSGIVSCNVPHLWPRITPAIAVSQTPRSWYASLISAPGLGPWALKRDLPRFILTRGNGRQPFSPEELEGYLAPLREPARREATIALYRAYQRILVAGLAGRPKWPPLDLPALVLFGTKDLWVSERLLTEPIPQAPQLRIERAPGSGHFIANERPDLIIDRALALFG